jgi:hypothetical protein
LGMPVSGSGQMMGMGQGTKGAEGMPASTLLDASSLPAWMREESSSGAPGAAQPGGMGMSAGSLIDMGALPQWMRNDENAQKSGNLQSAGPQNAGAARNEGIRVPSRPRTDIGTQGQSEVAANVFSAMLGVSASAPVIPGQAQAPVPASNLGVAQGPVVPPPPMPAPASPPPLPGWQSPQQPAAAQQSVQPPAWQLSGSSAHMGAAPVPNASMPGGQPAGMGGMQPQGYRMEQSAYPAFSADRAGAGSAIGAGGSRGENQATDAKKKGFFDAIRDFFFK